MAHQKGSLKQQVCSVIPNATVAILELTADRQQRSVSQMIEILVTEGLAARGLL